MRTTLCNARPNRFNNEDGRKRFPGLAHLQQAMFLSDPTTIYLCFAQKQGMIQFPDSTSWGPIKSYSENLNLALPKNDAAFVIDMSHNQKNYKLIHFIWNRFPNIKRKYCTDFGTMKIEQLLSDFLQYIYRAIVSGVGLTSCLLVVVERPVFSCLFWQLANLKCSIFNAAPE